MLKLKGQCPLPRVSLDPRLAGMALKSKLHIYQPNCTLQEHRTSRAKAQENRFIKRVCCSTYKRAALPLCQRLQHSPKPSKPVQYQTLQYTQDSHGRSFQLLSHGTHRMRDHRRAQVSSLLDKACKCKIDRWHKKCMRTHHRGPDLLSAQ